MGASSHPLRGFTVGCAAGAKNFAAFSVFSETASVDKNKLGYAVEYEQIAEIKDQDNIPVCCSSCSGHLGGHGMAW